MNYISENVAKNFRAGSLRLFEIFDLLYKPLIVKLKEYLLDGYCVKTMLVGFLETCRYEPDISFEDYLEGDLAEDILMHLGYHEMRDDLFGANLSVEDARIRDHFFDIIKSSIGADYLHHIVKSSGYWDAVINLYNDTDLSKAV